MCSLALIFTMTTAGRYLVTGRYYLWQYYWARVCNLAEATMVREGVYISYYWRTTSPNFSPDFFLFLLCFWTPKYMEHVDFSLFSNSRYSLRWYKNQVKNLHKCRDSVGSLSQSTAFLQKLLIVSFLAQLGWKCLSHCLYSPEVTLPEPCESASGTYLDLLLS